MGVASWRWVRAILTILSQAAAWDSSFSAVRLTAGRRLLLISMAAARWMAVGKVSLEDWPRLTWSLGWTAPGTSFKYAGSFDEPMGRCSRRQTMLAITSLTFMFVEVPEPVWKMSMGKW